MKMDKQPVTEVNINIPSSLVEEANEMAKQKGYEGVRDMFVKLLRSGIAHYRAGKAIEDPDLEKIQ